MDALGLFQYRLELDAAHIEGKQGGCIIGSVEMCPLQEITCWP